MQLFKSHGLQEPPRAAVPSYRDRGFDRRYGRRNSRRAAPAFDLAVAGNDGDGDFELEAERAILRLMADYDRAA